MSQHQPIVDEQQIKDLVNIIASKRNVVVVGANSGQHPEIAMAIDKSMGKEELAKLLDQMFTGVFLAFAITSKRMGASLDDCMVGASEIMSDAIKMAYTRAAEQPAATIH